MGSDVELDALIDEALGSYAAQEPPAGLEMRILQRVRAEGQSGRRFDRWWMAWAVPVLACGVFLFVSVGWRSEKLPVLVLRPVAVAKREVVVAPVSVRRRSVRHVRSEPRRAIFPSPSPMTEQERALLAFVAAAPPEMLRAYAEEQQQEITPIRIESIEIAPLPGSGAQ